MFNERARKWEAGALAIVRVRVLGGCHHEDVGYGKGADSNRAIAVENANKEAVTDAVKRALRYFGSVMGNCIYDKQYLRTLNPRLALDVRQPLPASQLRQQT